jgi:hypothetical protein
MTTDRLIHLIIGFALLWYVMGRPMPKLAPYQWVLLLGACALGTWMPDWDLKFGIGYHRSPLTHSALPAVVLALGVMASRLPLDKLVVGFAIGLASHLLWDIIFYGDVRWIKGGNYDRLFLLGNAIALLVWVHFRKPGKG